MQPKPPNAPAAPVLSPSQITIAGSPLPGAAAIYQGFRAQVSELNDQMSSLENSRANLTRQLEQAPQSSNAKTGLEQRIAAIDGRIIEVDKQIGIANAQLAKAAAIPGAAVEPPRAPQTGPPEEFVMSALFITGALLLPLSIAYARRIWRRSSGPITPFPKEIGERLGRVEQSVDATALEVERIGEGQRFLTRLFTEGDGVRPLAAPAQHLLERKSDNG